MVAASSACDMAGVRVLAKGRACLATRAAAVIRHAAPATASISRSGVFVRRKSARSTVEWWM